MEMDGKEIFFTLLRKWPVILVSLVIGALLLYGFSMFFISPVYEARATMIVNKNSGEDSGKQTDYNDILMTQKLVKTYSIIMRSKTVLSNVINRIGLDMSPEDLKENITIQGLNETEVLEIIVENEDRELAALIANTIADIAPDIIIHYTNAVNARVLDRAQVPQDPSKPNKLQYAFIGSIIGLVFSVSLVLLKAYFDDTFKTEEEIKNYLEIPVLASLPELIEDKKR